MTGNAPDFDPLNPTPEEQADMLAGYLAAGGGTSKPEITSAAFDHGWRVRRNDKAGVVDDDQRELAHRLLSRDRATRRASESEVVRLAQLEDDIARFQRRGLRS